jgi:hypothetical protein
VGTTLASRTKACACAGGITAVMAAFLKATKSKSLAYHRAKVRAFYGLVATEMP